MMELWGNRPEAVERRSSREGLSSWALLRLALRTSLVPQMMMILSGC